MHINTKYRIESYETLDDINLPQFTNVRRKNVR